MIRSAMGKVAWMARATTTVVGLAIMLALVLGVATTAFGANGQNLILGSLTNAATKVTGLVGNVDGAAALRVSNPNAGTNDTALDLRVQAGEAPMTVNSAKKVANLNADRIDDREASSFANGVGGKATNADRLDGLDSSHFAQANTEGSALHAVSAGNADKLDNKDSSAFAGTGMSRYNSEALLSGCSEKVLASSEISPSRPALVYASGASVYDSNSAPLTGGQLQLELRNATNTTTLASGGFIYVNGGGNQIPLSLQGVLMSGSDAYNSTTPFEVTPGNSYVLRLVGNGTDGTCTGTPVMSNIVLSYVLIGK